MFLAMKDALDVVSDESLSGSQETKVSKAAVSVRPIPT